MSESKLKERVLSLATQIEALTSSDVEERRAEIERMRAELTDSYGVRSIVRTSERGEREDEQGADIRRYLTHVLSCTSRYSPV